MESPLTPRAALLQALRDGPACGPELIQRVNALTGGQVRLSTARAYPTLEALQRAGLVSASRSAPLSARGARARTTYGLTLRGVEAAAAERDVLRAFVGREGRPRKLSKRENDLMVRRLLEGAELSEAALDLRAAMRSAERA